MGGHPHRLALLLAGLVLGLWALALAAVGARPALGDHRVLASLAACPFGFHPPPPR